MMERYTQFETGEYYHVYNRGVNKYKIFFSKGDWEHFQRLLYTCNSTKSIRKASRVQGAPLDISLRGGERLVDILSYALMENHFHLLLHERQDGGISKFMSKLLTAYSMYMNKKYDRSGPLMCRPFRSRHIDSDEYLRWVISYIHLNPIDQIAPKWKDDGIDNLKTTEEFLKSYKYSSHQDYFPSNQGTPGDNVRQESAILNKDALPIDISDIDDLRGVLKEYSNKKYLDVDE